MIRTTTFLFASLFTLLLYGCEKAPAVEHKLSAEQLTWQPYRAGDILRFGHARDNKVRTYRITEVRDTTDSFSGIFFGTRPIYQHIVVMAQRTDTVSRPEQVLEINLAPITPSFIQPLWARVSWESCSTSLPIDKLNEGTPLDTVDYKGIRLLQLATFGPTIHAQVVHMTDYYRGPGAQPAHIYYARNKGVVAFKEGGTDLWYRLP